MSGAAGQSQHPADVGAVAPDGVGQIFEAGYSLDSSWACRYRLAIASISVWFPFVQIALTLK